MKKKVYLKKFKLKKFLTTIFLFCLAIAVLFSLYSDFFKDERIICIDAGHGGESIGAVFGNDERLEKDDNLRLALLLKKELSERDIKVLMTRTEDKDVSLEKRCRIGNMNKADYFISLHRNSSDNIDANGTEIWISQNPRAAEAALADFILSNLAAVGISENRGVKYGFREGDGEYYINSQTTMPSCLVELGFISNKGDNKEFDENIEKYATAIAEAVEELYEKEIHQKES